LTNNPLDWQLLLPDATPYQTIFAGADQLTAVNFATIQPRLHNGLALFCHPLCRQRFMAIVAAESNEYLSQITDAVQALQPAKQKKSAYQYVVTDNQVTLEQVNDSQSSFASPQFCTSMDWLEPEQLFGCVRYFNEKITLQPGLIHQANGGVLILSIRSLLAQPLMWLRLKQMITSQFYTWQSPDENKPLPVSIPGVDLDIKLILVGDRFSLGEFEEMEPELLSTSVYGEYESDFPLTDEDSMRNWCAYINGLCDSLSLPRLADDAWPLLLERVIRQSGDQGILLLNPAWLSAQLSEAALYNEDPQHFSCAALEKAELAKAWRESYLQERLQDEIELQQIRIETDGEVIGQINGLSVLEYPGHPRATGEPSRISCVVHIGDGELTDVERKAELGGNLHAKGMMIMQSFLVSELQLEQPLPFSASIVFEQSYGEIDGDSATLAELCVLISALTMQPINQQIAVTGSVDQLGNVQPIGGINEKIEGFFEVCQRRGLTGKQGVILPLANVRNLCLDSQVVEAVREGNFHLWAVDHVAQALPILTGLPYADEEKLNLLGIIQERVAQVSSQERGRTPWFLRWLNWFNRS
jgi:Lon-like ATP-dependent protease